MDDGFVFDDKRDYKDIFKWVSIIVAVIVGITSLIMLLIFSSVNERVNSCAKISEEIGIDRCDNPFKRVIFVVGDTANTPTPFITEQNTGIISYMYDMEKYGENGLSFISVANPNDPLKPFNTRKKGTENIAKGVVDQISTMAAENDGADYLEAIRNVASRIKDKDKGDTLLYIIGSGLSDKGLLNFAGNDILVNHSSEEIRNAVLASIEDKNELSGLTIIWDGLGDTVSPQETLSENLKNKEKNIYRNVLEGMGVDHDDLLILNDGPKDNKVNERVKTTVKKTSIKSDDMTFIYSSDTSELAFNPSQASFKNQSAAEAEIRRLVNKYKNSYFTIEPFMSRGMCNWGKDEELLNSRFNATKELFINVGHISVDDIKKGEGGIGDANECPNGPGNYHVDETEAVKNRKVEISIIRK